MTVELSSVCSIVKGGLDPQKYPATTYAHYSLPAFDAGAGRVIEIGESIHSQKTPIPGDVVLVSKLNPRIPRVWRVAGSQSYARICSTEFVALKPDYSKLDAGYLEYGLRAALQGGAIKGNTAAATRSRERAKPADFLRLKIKLPSLSEQRRIVDLLSRAENIARMRREAEQKAKEIIPALFLDMFGDPATNPRGWDVKAFEQVIADGPQNGLYKHADAYGSGTPILRIDGFYDGRVTPISDWKRLRLNSLEEHRFRLEVGDIVINRVNSPEYLGKSGLIPPLNEPVVFESNMMRVSVSKDMVLPEFVIAFLQTPFARSTLTKNAKHAINQSSINQGDVKAIPIYVPPISAQVALRARVTAVRRLEDLQAKAAVQADGTLQSLLAEVFEN